MSLRKAFCNTTPTNLSQRWDGEQRDSPREELCRCVVHPAKKDTTAADVEQVCYTKRQGQSPLWSCLLKFSCGQKPQSTCLRERRQEETLQDTLQMGRERGDVYPRLPRLRRGLG